MHWQRVLLAVLALALTCSAYSYAAPQPGQKTFSSPDAAVQAMVDALRKDDKATILAIFGKKITPVMSTGDAVADRNTVANFLKRYDEMHRVGVGPEGKTFLYIGADNWPMPIPLVQSGSNWYFDTGFGLKEILYRRIGANELGAINVCMTLVQAEHEYFNQQHDGDTTKQFAQKFLSDPGKQNGLYWKTAAGQPESPIGPLVVAAAAEGYHRSENGTPSPYHGYYYKFLFKHAASNGTQDFVVNGKMTDGFAIMAFPAKYRSSGVMTFIVDQDGIVYQKDLGPKTAEIAKSMTVYDPSSDWEPAG